MLTFHAEASINITVPGDILWDIDVSDDYYGTTGRTFILYCQLRELADEKEGGSLPSASPPFKVLPGAVSFLESDTRLRHPHARPSIHSSGATDVQESNFISPADAPPTSNNGPTSLVLVVHLSINMVGLRILALFPLFVVIVLLCSRRAWSTVCPAPASEFDMEESKEESGYEGGLPTQQRTWLVGPFQ